MNTKTFDHIIQDVVQPFGRWQIAIYVCMVLPMCCPLDMILVFINMSPPHYYSKCANDEITATGTFLSIKNKTNNQSISDCFPTNVNQNMTQFLTLQNPSNNMTNASYFQRCSGGYIFNTEEHEHVGTITEEFSLVCDRAYIRSLSPMILMFGQCISCLISGWAADKYGRRSVIIITGIGQFLLALITPLSPNIELFIFLQFFNGFVNIAIFNTCFILTMEITDSKYRNILAMVVAINTGIFNYTLSSMGSYLAQNWRNFYYLMSLAALPSVLFPFIVNESPRWLLVVGKKKAALTILKSATIKNNRVLSDDKEKMLEDFVANYEDAQKLPERGDTFRMNCWRILKSISLIFTASSIRARMLPLIYLWLQTSFVYYGSLFNSVQIGGNPYIVFWLTGVMMVPAGIFRFILSKCIECKSMLIILQVSASVSFAITLCFQIMIQSEQYRIMVVIAAIVSKFQMDVLFNLLYVYSPLLIPTEIRNYGLGICSSAARLGSSIAPLVVQHGGRTWTPLPTLVSIILLFLGIFISFALPRISDDLPDRISDLKKLKQSEEIEVCIPNDKQFSDYKDEARNNDSLI